MKLRVLAVGKPKEPFIIEGIDHYAKRLKTILPVEFIWVPETKKQTDPKTRKDLEASEILKKISPQDRLILLDERGTDITSISLSQMLYQQLETARSKVTFLIGGPYGVSEEIFTRSDKTIKLSHLTLTHEMALLLLTEQIYRSAMIRQGSPYHHI